MGSGISKPQASLLESKLDDAINKSLKDCSSSGKYKKDKSQIIFPPENNKFLGVFVGCLLLSRDQFTSKYSGQKKYKWRTSEITAIDGLVIRVHFQGWSPKHDRSISLELDWKNLAPINLLSARQREEGGALNREQSAACYYYLSTGRMSEGIENGNSDSDYSLASDAENSIAPSSARSRNSRGNGDTRGSFKSNTNNKGNSGSSNKIRNSRSFEQKKLNDNKSEIQQVSPYSDLTVGQRVEVQDIFKKREDEGVYVKWRLAEITGINDNIVRIHFIGWDPKWDEEIDVLQDRERIREYSEQVVSDNTTKSRSLKDNKQKRKSATALNFNSQGVKQLQTVTEDRSERSSPSVSKSSSGIFSINKTGQITKIFQDALLQLPTPTTPVRGSGSSLDSVIEDDIDLPRKSQLSIDDKIRMAMEMADKEVGNLLNKGVDKEVKTPSKRVSITKLQTDVNSPSKRLSVTKLQTDAEIPPLNSARSIKATPRGTLRSRRISFPGPAQLSADDFKKKLESSGMFIKQVINDGNSLFRAISHQLFLTEIKHQELRIACVKHMLEHKERFALYCTINFNEHVKHIAEEGFSGDELEIKVMEEVLDRIFHVYSKEVMNFNMEPVPKELNEDEKLLLKDVKPIKILSLGSGHYYSVVNECDPFEMTERTTHMIRNARVKLFSMICTSD